MKNTLSSLIQMTFKQLEKPGLADGALKSYRTRAFHPIETTYYSRYATCFCKEWLIEIKDDFKQQYAD